MSESNKIIEYDYSKLMGKIIETFKTRQAFANAIGRSEKSVSDKLNNKVAWTQLEMNKAVEALNLKFSDIPDYFFTLLVQNN